MWSNTESTATAAAATKEMMKRKERTCRKEGADDRGRRETRGGGE